MKIAHLSDLHLGKRLNEYNLLEDQKYILAHILNIIDQECPSVIALAGDIYDKSIPSVEAIQLFDWFLRELAKRQLHVMIISGNHDSAERLAFGSTLMNSSGIHISPPFDGTISSVSLEDEYGPVHFHLMPFVKPIHIQHFFETTFDSHTDALRFIIEKMNVDTSQRNVLLAHQFVTGASRTDSEDLSVGDADNVDANVFEIFDYVALGHLHSPQYIGKPFIRYCGSPLKYSFFEAQQSKSIPIVELGPKGNVSIRTIPLTPKHDLRTLRGSYEELTNKKNYKDTTTDDYLAITLTDEQEILEVMSKLRTIYPNLMQVTYDNQKTRNRNNLIINTSEKKTPLQLVSEFFQQQNGGKALTDEQTSLIKELIEQIWGNTQQ